MPPTLHITGEHDHRGFVVVVGDRRRTTAQAPFELLLELVTARIGTTHGYLYKSACLSTDRDDCTTNQYIKRLRSNLGDVNKTFILTCTKSYKLACEPEDIRVDRALFDIPATMFDARILARLKTALDAHELVTPIALPCHNLSE